MLIAVLTASVLPQPWITFSPDLKVETILGKIWWLAAFGATTKKAIAPFRKWAGL
jgi:hypothetical protein